MSEPKRVVPQSLEFPDSLGHATKKEKKREKKGKQIAPSYRFTIALPESNDTVYSDINYAQLLKQKEKKRRKAEQRADDENATNGLSLFDDDGDDDEDKLREVARRFEAKYGTATAGRKRHKFDDDVDLGAGYDESDSFIDNTDAYDEIVPAEMTTAHGGFYINSGPLEFRPAENDLPVQNCLNNINNNNEDENSEENDENAEDDDDEEEANEIPKRFEKRIISSSEDDEDDENIGVPPRKKYKSEENGNGNGNGNSEKKAANHDQVIKKKRKLQTDQSNQQSGEDVEIVNQRKPSADDKREILDLECSSEDQEEKQKRSKYEVTTKTKAIGEQKKKFDIKRFEKKGTSTSNGALEVKKIDMKKCAAGGKDSNIDDAIESVVNAGRADDESSRDTLDSGKSRGLAGTESECDEMDKEETPLPEPLPDDIKDIINRIKLHVDKNKDGKGKIFDDYVNNTLLSLDGKLRTVNPPNTRLLTYAHLAHFLRCSKVTLINRVKKLCLEDAEKKVKLPLQRLKVIIEGMMPTVVERYAKECQRIAEEKSLEGSPVEGESSDAEASEKSKIPRKKFPWTTETKKLVYEIGCARRHYFKIRKPRKESIESFVANFMESKVLPLWPGGWMRLSTLLKYSNPEPVEKRKQKKLRDASSVANSVSGATATVTNSTPRPEVAGASVANNVLPTSSQESAKSPTFVTKSASDNPINFSMSPAQIVKPVDPSPDKKPSGNIGKHREKSNESIAPVSLIQQQEISVTSANSQSMAKITVVPTSQLMAQKPVKSITEKFNSMPSSSVSITPVNDYQKPSKLPSETKKDVIVITPYNEPSNIVNDTLVITPSGTLSTTRTEPISSYTIQNSSATLKPVLSKHRLPENCETKNDKKIDEKLESETQKTEKKEKKRDRWPEEKHRSQESKKRRKELKLVESSGQQQQNPQVSKSCELATSIVVPPPPQSSLSKEEQEQRQIEETMAATNFLSQIINDDPPRIAADIRKDTTVLSDDPIVNVVQTSEQDNDVQMVMRSLKELQELQEMKYSPSHSPVGGGQQKSAKSSHQYAGYQDDYHRLYSKKEDKIRVPKEENPW